MTDLDLPKIASNIELKEDGIYYSIDSSEISYPDEGNQHCFQIEQDSFWFKHRNNVILEAVRQFSNKATFYDIGGGNGFVAKGLEEAGVPTVLIEPGNGVANAKSRGLQYVVCSTLEDAGFKDSSIPAAGMFDVVEHIENDGQFLEGIQRFLKKDGYVYITVPAFNFLWSNIDNHSGHFRRYTIKSMSKVLRQSGFEVEYATYFFSILPLPVFLFRTLPSKLGLIGKENNKTTRKKEHKTRKGIISRLLDKIWAWEIRKIAKRQRIPFGGSCFVVARKK